MLEFCQQFETVFDKPFVLIIGQIIVENGGEERYLRGDAQLWEVVHEDYVEGEF